MTTYSIRINQIKVEVNTESAYVAKEVTKKFNELCRIKALKGVASPVKSQDDIVYKVTKRSIDSRHKPRIYYVYSVDIESVKGCDISKIVALLKSVIEKGNVKLPKDIIIASDTKYEFPVVLNEKELLLASKKKVIIGGFGPAGIFAALKLVRAGFCPIVLERGQSVEERTETVNKFWETGELDIESNVQFGEGGAGTFSDGKLNTMIKDPTGRIKEVLNEFVNFGADSSILYVNKPHIGTDVLAKVVKNIREFIIASGGEIYFNTKITDLIIKENVLKGVKIVNTRTKEESEMCCDSLCLSIGHSARDTFEMINKKANIGMEPKAFAVGLRIEHPQGLIDNNAYGDCECVMPAADYKVTCQTGKGRGVYSFCMCPGGYVVNASSEQGRLAVNGMSYSKRDGDNANSALIVTVTPDDFGFDVLDGVHFQQELEKSAYEAAKGAVPVQLLGDYCKNRKSTKLGRVTPSIKGQYDFANLREVLPEYINEAIIEGVSHFGSMIKGFDMEDAVFSGVESRTSSPVRILRDAESLQASVKGLYPCGEGAGYAGGITSAAVDGIKVAEKIALNTHCSLS